MIDFEVEISLRAFIRELSGSVLLRGRGETSLGRGGHGAMMPSQQMPYRESRWEDDSSKLSRFGLDAQAFGSLPNRKLDVGCVTLGKTHQG